MVVDRLNFEDIVRIQKMMLSRIVQENEVDQKVRVLDIINQVLGSKKSIQLEAIILEAEKNNISEDNLMSILSELEKDKLIFIKDSRLYKTF